VTTKDRFFGGQTMAGALRRVLVCTPSAAGWDDPAQAGRWRELGYFHPPVPSTAAAEHAGLCRQLRSLGTEVVLLPPGAGLSPDALFPRDATLITDRGALPLAMGKPARRGEPDHHAAFLGAHEIPVLEAIALPGAVEGGDLVWLASDLLLAGHSYRTNREGIEQLRTRLAPHGIEVVSTPLPHGRGPEVCTHLGSILSVVAPSTALVDLPLLAVETVEILRHRGFRLIEVDPAERDRHACNVLALGDDRVLALVDNPSTCRRLEEAGLQVLTFSGQEICHNGGGGPTCLTLPLLRDPETPRR
jgi:N-dimethylarginine dimethylaminohydrolase